MAKKEKVSLVRSEAFESVEDALTAAMLRLDASNDRVGKLLSGDGLLPGIVDEQPEPADTPRLPERPARGAADA